MSAWDGWVADMISGLDIPAGGDNTNFLTNWATYDRTACRFNPLIASHKEPGSTACKRLNSLNTAQAYDSHADAIAGTKAQLDSGAYTHLRAALHSGDPIGYEPLSGVTLDLQKWGAVNWSAQVAAANNLPGLGPGASTPMHASAAWSRWMRALAHNGPDAHNRIRRATVRARRIAR